MTAHEIRNEVDQFVALLSEIGLLVRSHATTIRSHSGLTWVTWTRPLDGGLPLGGETVAGTAPFSEMASTRAPFETARSYRSHTFLMPTNC